MPQPLSKVCPKATISLSAGSLNDKPQLARAVCNIIAASAQLDHELSLLMARLVGSDATAAITMFDALRGYARKQALESVARTVLNRGQHRVFCAVIQMAETAQSDRHKIAHGIWGSCPELPDALLLADPSFLRWQEVERGKTRKLTTLAEVLSGVTSFEDTSRLYELDKNKILVYRGRELVDSYMGLLEVMEGLSFFRFYMRPLKRVVMDDTEAQERFDRVLKGLDTSAGALRRLNTIRRFREAVASQGASVVTRRNKKPLAPPG